MPVVITPDLNDFDPEDEATQFWLDALDENPIVLSTTCEFLDRCYKTDDAQKSGHENC